MHARGIEVVPLDLTELCLNIVLEQRDENKHRSDAEVCQIYFGYLKDSLRHPEVLVLHGMMLWPYNTGMVEKKEYLCYFDEGFATLLPPGETGRPGYSHAVFLDKALYALVEEGVVECRASAFPRTREAAKTMGVRVHSEHGALDLFADGICRGIFGVGLSCETIG